MPRLRRFVRLHRRRAGVLRLQGFERSSTLQGLPRREEIAAPGHPRNARRRLRRVRCAVSGPVQASSGGRGRKARSLPRVLLSKARLIVTLQSEEPRSPQGSGVFLLCALILPLYGCAPESLNLPSQSCTAFVFVADWPHA